jgi:hypothetical protein
MRPGALSAGPPTGGPPAGGPPRGVLVTLLLGPDPFVADPLLADAPVADALPDAPPLAEPDPLVPCEDPDEEPLLSTLAPLDPP